MDIKDIKDLIITIDKTSIDSVEIEKNDIKVIITKRGTVDKGEFKIPTEKIVEEIEIPNRNIEVSEEVLNEDVYIVKSPIVGTFYRSSSPDNPPFVNQGDRVETGQTLCIIEAMKIMNEIKSDVAGEIIEVLVDDEEIVEYGQPLMRIRR